VKGGDFPSRTKGGEWDFIHPTPSLETVKHIYNKKKDRGDLLGTLGGKGVVLSDPLPTVLKEKQLCVGGKKSMIRPEEAPPLGDQGGQKVREKGTASVFICQNGFWIGIQKEGKRVVLDNGKGGGIFIPHIGLPLRGAP